MSYILFQVDKATGQIQERGEPLGGPQPPAYCTNSLMTPRRSMDFVVEIGRQTKHRFSLGHRVG